jgi:hypothetical protein
VPERNWRGKGEGIGKGRGFRGPRRNLLDGVNGASRSFEILLLLPVSSKLRRFTFRKYTKVVDKEKYFRIKPNFRCQM